MNKNEGGFFKMNMNMKFSKEELSALAALPDDALWCEIQRIAEGYGLKLPPKKPPHEDLEKLRSFARGERIPTAEMMRLVSKYRKEYGI